MSITLNNLEFNIYYNVKDYWINMFDYPIWNFDYYDEKININTDITYILLLECNYHCSFGHWVHETAIFLPYFKKLKEKYRTLKLFIINEPYRSYKKLFLDFFDISKDDIIYCNNELKHNDYNEMWMKRFNIFFPKNNICLTTPIYPLILKPYDKLNIPESIYIDNISNLQKCFNITKEVKIDIDWLFFPRCKKENYKPNDKVYNYNNIIGFLQDKNHIIYDVMETKRLEDQINLIKRSKNIILDPTSSFSVNGLFCKNKNIYLTSPIVHSNIKSCELIYKYILKYNKLCSF